MGTIDADSDRLVETYYVHHGAKELILLRAEAASKEWDIRTDVRRLQDGDTMNIRIKFNPNIKGRRRQKPVFYFNDLTYTIDIKANVEYIDVSDHTPCPDFENGAKSPEAETWKAFFRTVDSVTDEPIPNTEIILDGKTTEPMSFRTDGKGEIEVAVPIDFYSIKVIRDEYSQFRQDNYINKRSRRFTLRLMKNEPPPLVIDSAIVEVPVVHAEEILVEEEIIVEVPSEPSEFALTEFKPNNVVFLIDVSTSMRHSDRIEVLKSAMIELAEMLRPDDIISIVTYASTTEVLLSGKRADDHAQISEIIESLKAEGETASEAGLKQAYSICKKHFILNGNNHVYLATDGAFYQDLPKMEKRVIRMQDEEMHLSILAIRSNRGSDARMIDLAKSGGGMHLKLENEENKEELKELIKVQSKR